jgi:hypothetical protein
MNEHSITINPINDTQSSIITIDSDKIIHNNNNNNKCTITDCILTTFCFLLFMFLLFLSFSGYVLLLAVNGSDDST